MERVGLKQSTKNIFTGQKKREEDVGINRRPTLNGTYLLFFLLVFKTCTKATRQHTQNQIL